MIKAIGVPHGGEHVGSSRAGVAGGAAWAGLLAAAVALAGCGLSSPDGQGDEAAERVEALVVARAEATEAPEAVQVEDAALPSLAMLPEPGTALGLGKRDLAGYRDQARADALFVSALCVRYGRCGARYQFYRILYNRAATAFDVMIKNMAASMKKMTGHDKTLYFHYTIEEAAVQFSLLKNTSDRIIADVRRGSVRSAESPATDLNRIIDRTQQEITDNFRQLANAYRNGRADQRRHILDRLGALNWARFEELPKMAVLSGLPK